MGRTSRDRGAGGPQYGFWVFTFSSMASPEVIDFMREYRARASAYAFCGDMGLCRPFSKYVYVPAVAAVYKHVLNRSGSVLKASHVWPVLPVRFLTEGGGYGNNSAPVVVDLRKRELRIPFLGVKIGVREGIAEKLFGLLGDEVKPRFAAQLVLSEDGMGREIVKVNVIAMRRKNLLKNGKKLYVGVDLNSRYGVTLIAVAVEGAQRNWYSSSALSPPTTAGGRKRSPGYRGSGKERRPGG